MTTEKRLERELRALREKKEKAKRMKSLKKQIRSEKFSQTRGGKIFNYIGDTGIKVVKKIATPPKQTPTKNGKKRSSPSVHDVIKNMEKSMGGSF